MIFKNQVDFIPLSQIVRDFVRNELPVAPEHVEQTSAAITKWAENLIAYDREAMERVIDLCEPQFFEEHNPFADDEYLESIKIAAKGIVEVGPDVVIREIQERGFLFVKGVVDSKWSKEDARLWCTFKDDQHKAQVQAIASTTAAATTPTPAVGQAEKSGDLRPTMDKLLETVKAHPPSYFTKAKELVAGAGVNVQRGLEALQKLQQQGELVKDANGFQVPEPVPEPKSSTQEPDSESSRNLGSNVRNLGSGSGNLSGTGSAVKAQTQAKPNGTRSGT